MKKIITCMALACVMALCCTAQESEQDLTAKYDAALLAAGTPAPDFKLVTPDGDTLTLKDFRGKYLVLDFWAIWCKDCIAALPHVEAAFERFRDKDVMFLGVSLDDNKDNWVKGIKDYRLEYLHGSELKKWRRTDIAPAYAIDWIPTIYIIDPQGKVILGTISVDKAVKTLERITAGK